MDKFITISHDMIRDKSLTMHEKFVLLEINNLTMLEYGCVAHNDHFANMLGIAKQSVSRIVASLEAKGVITSTIKKGSRNFSRTIVINSTHHKMFPDPSQNVSQPITNCLQSKGNITTNKEPSIEIPSWMDKNVWNEWVQFRKEIKKTLTPSTMKKQLAMLEKQKDHHTEIINNSITNGWTGLFPLTEKQLQESPNTKKVVGQYYDGWGVFQGYNSQGLERYAN